jgi:hypothetical protein
MASEGRRMTDDGPPILECTTQHHHPACEPLLMGGDGGADDDSGNDTTVVDNAPISCPRGATTSSTSRACSNCGMGGGGHSLFFMR